MRLTHAQLYPLEIPLINPIKMSGETVSHAQTLLLRLIDDQGREGWGEACSAPLMTGETLESLCASAAYLVEQLLAVDIGGPEAIAPLQDKVLYGNSSARSCHETALMDLLAQRQGVPLHRLLAGGESPAAPAPGRIEMLHMLASGRLESEIEEARALRRDGYRHWKIKVGAGDTAEDVRRVRGLCAELQGDVLSADANTALSPEDAGAIAQAGAAAGLAFLEQPFAAGTVSAMAELHRASGLALCADESIHGLDDIIAHHAAQAAQGISLKLIKLGGLLPALAAGRLCLARGMRLNLACKVAETTVSAAATAHVGFALGDIAWGYSMSNRYLQADVCDQPLAPVRGAITAEQVGRPGLGFAPRAERLRDFASAALRMREFRA
jgi:L-alanine-DL-glutamate epimerase-like enolase superfamily enzyme